MPLVIQQPQHVPKKKNKKKIKEKQKKKETKQGLNIGAYKWDNKQSTFLQFTRISEEASLPQAPPGDFCVCVCRTCLRSSTIMAD